MQLEASILLFAVESNFNKRVAFQIPQNLNLVVNYLKFQMRLNTSKDPAGWN